MSEFCATILFLVPNADHGLHPAEKVKLPSLRLLLLLNCSSAISKGRQSPSAGSYQWSGGTEGRQGGDVGGVAWSERCVHCSVYRSACLSDCGCLIDELHQQFITLSVDVSITAWCLLMLMLQTPLHQTLHHDPAALLTHCSAACY